ncbi:MAG: hypothetical protein HQM11_07715 [SAR324 cluster bacterium]|nr:hypothetical protein [SAR324 cluster bacterium]
MGTRRAGIYISDQTQTGKTLVTELRFQDGAITSIEGDKANIDESAGAGHGTGLVTAHSDMIQPPAGGIGITASERQKLTHITITIPISLDTIGALLEQFNGISQLVKTDGAGKLPILSGENLVGVLKTTDAGSVFLEPDGDGSQLQNLPTDYSRAKSGINSDITSLLGLLVPLSQDQGGTGTNAVANNPNGIVVLDGSGRIPASVSGILLQDVRKPLIVDNLVTDYTILPEDFDHKILTTTGAENHIAFTLPSANLVTGKKITIVKTSSKFITIKTVGTDKINETQPGGTYSTDATALFFHLEIMSVGGGLFVAKGIGAWVPDENYIQ